MTKKSAKKQSSSAAREDKTAVLLRLSPEEIRRLDALAQRMPFASRAGLAYAAMLIGLRDIEHDPAILLSMGGKPAAD